MAKLVSANLINNAKLCILYYNTTDSKKLFDEEWSNLFDADIISHTYDKVGTVIFEKQITRICDKAFSDVTNLKSIWIPSGVISIGERTFKGCSNLTSITIPNSITEIGRNAFEKCENIRGVYISDLSSWCRIKFSDMQANPLYYAKKLYLDGNLITELIIPSEVTDIAYYAFCSCCSLTSVTIPDSVTKIRGKAFYECSKLTSITIPDSVTYIGDYAFKGCSELTSITIPDSVTKIDFKAFEGCSSLRCVHISDLSSWCRIKFSNVQANPLYYAKNLYLDRNLVAELVIPSDIKKIEDYAFYNCSCLVSVLIPSDIIEIGNGAFHYCSNLTSATIYDNCPEVEFEEPYDSRPIIRGPLFDKCPNLTAFYGKFTSKDNRCFIKNKKLKSFASAGLTEYSIPDGVTEIENGAFHNCSSLTSVIIPDSVTEIGDYAFKGCSELTSITIPDSVTYIGDYAFKDCCSLKNLVIGDGITYIGHKSFDGCNNLIKAIVPENFTKEKWSDRFGDYSIKDVYVNVVNLASYCKIDRVQFGIHTHILVGNNEITELVIPNGVTEIGERVFKDCSSLTSVIIPDSVTKIGDFAFKNCNSLTSVTIGNSVTKIGEDAFYGCESLKGVYISDLSTWCRIDFGNKWEWSHAEYANPLYYAKNLYLNGELITKLIIPSDIKEVKRCAFLNCNSLINVTIPSNITAIGKKAFWGCNIDTIICYAKTPPKLHETHFGKGKYQLSSFERFETIIVPVGCEDVFSTSDWGRYIREETIRYDKYWHCCDESFDDEYDDYDTEYESYLALGGDPEKYRKGCLDNYMESIGM